MPSNINPKMLDGLSQMVHSSIPAIRADIESFLQDTTQFDALEKAYQNVHPIKDVADMLGLSVLQHITQCITEMIEEIATGASVDVEQGAWLCSTVDQVEPFVQSLQSGDGRDQDIVNEVIRSFRRFKGLPESEDDVAVQAALSGQSVASGEMLLPPVAEARNVHNGDMGTPATESDDFQIDFAAELLEGFLLEAEDYLDTIGRLLPGLSGSAKNNDQLLQVRRSIHTLKGAAGVVGLMSVSYLSHRMEDLLDDLYEGNRELTPETQDLLCATFDALEAFLRDQGAQGDFEPVAQSLYAQYDVALGSVAEPLSDPPTESAMTTLEQVPAAATDPAQECQPATSSEEAATPAIQMPSDVVRVPIGRLDELVRLVGEMAISRSVYEQQLARLTHQVEELYLSIERLQRTSTTIETQYEVSALVGSQSDAPRLLDAGLSRAGREWTGIIEFDELEFDRYSEFHLMSRDLTETSADIGALGNEFKEILGEFDSYLTRQSRLTTEIQDKLMEFRMVPLASMATRLQRAVRVTARQRNKEVELYLEGEGVPFDKSILEEMNEALLHLLRNAVDHGIEAPDVRRNSNKPQQGTIHLRALREGTQIVIQISDDGAGLDPQRLRAKAIQNGILSEEEAEQWRDDQLYPLIFAPGFSTAPEISQVSGRGVGMDIVHTIVSRLKGRITVDSTFGEGTTFTVRLPLTLALARVLLVKAYGQIFALPLADVIQVVTLDPQAFEYLGDTQVIRLDGNVLPIVPLGEKLGLLNPSDQTEDRVSVVVAQAGDKYVVFVVDELLGGREVVVKTLGTHLRHVHGITGSTIMGDGSIVLILNVSELVHEKQVRTLQKSDNRLPQASRANKAFEILVVDDSFSVRRVVANLVKSAGWQPILAKNGVEALDIVQRATRLPDLILLDVEMPQMDGYELTSTLRAQDAYQHLPIVMLTSRAGEKHRRKAFEVGATEYLVKPYQDATLVELIRRLVVQARGTSAV